jgi:hypothetical protein
MIILKEMIAAYNESPTQPINTKHSITSYDSWDQWRSKATPGPGARLPYRAPSLHKKLWEKLRAYILMKKKCLYFIHRSS